jgi:RimJ/RimL family protein N-acetyltransferase
LGWLHDPEVVRYLEVRHNPPATIGDLQEWVAGFDQRSRIILGVFDATENRHIGNVTLAPIDVRNLRAHLGYMVGDRAYWGRKVLVRVLPAVFNFAFGTLGLNKITAGADTRNLSSIINFKKLGFVKEGAFRQHIYENGTYFDEVRYALFKETWAVHRAA